jgi:serine/threonine protein kinase
MRGVGCAYIPKYYHSIQDKYEYRPYLLMDYVPGNNLTQEMEKKRESLTHSGKLHILTHLSNAIRFLHEKSIAHLDLSPSNILVVKDFLIKIVDFGEAYHHKTSHKYSLAARGEYGKLVYAPGRTFPYAPPETTCRLENFSSQQDMYSLGVIMH